MLGSYMISDGQEVSSPPRKLGTTDSSYFSKLAARDDILYSNVSKKSKPSQHISSIAISFNKKNNNIFVMLLNIVELLYDTLY